MAARDSSGILLVGEGSGVGALLGAELQSRAYRVITASHGEEGLAKAMRLNVDVVVCDLAMSGISGLELLTRLQSAKPRLPVILIAEAPDRDRTIEAMKLGAYDFLLKPFEMPELLEVISKAASGGGPAISASGPGEGELAHFGLVGMSRPMQELYKQIGLTAASSVTVLIQGATGTGKELIARAIHRHSARADQPFIAINCSAIPETLFEGELFGHESGAFTGARATLPGWFEEAHRGTLFLDEIGDLSAPVQVKLLRVLQEGCIQRVGGRREIPLDLRVVAATHRDLKKGIETGAFREDLFYRLCGLTINSPKLEEHLEDIPDLVSHFLRELRSSAAGAASSIQRDALEFLEKLPWPGNVRQLRNTVHHAAIVARNRSIVLEDVAKVCGQAAEMSSGKDAVPTTDNRNNPRGLLTDLLERARSGEIGDVRARVERSLFEKAMALAQGNLALVARWLGLTRATVRKKAREFGLLTTGDKPTSTQSNSGTAAADDSRSPKRSNIEADSDRTLL